MVSVLSSKKPKQITIPCGLLFRNAVVFVAGMLCMHQLSSFNAVGKSNFNFTTESESESPGSPDSNLEQMTRYDSRSGAQYMVDVAKSFEPVTDKVTDHGYDHMYGQFLLPYYRENPNMKFLEIGLGCDMNYGPGASVNVWKELFPKAELWEAEYDANCVKKSEAEGKLNGIHVLTGDQADIATLDHWIEKSGGDFDVIVDDGGHQSCQIWTSYLKLWPQLKSGGLYFMEDLHVGNLPHYNKISSPTCDKNVRVLDKLTEMNKQLLYGRGKRTDIKFIHCSKDSCVLGKK